MASQPVQVASLSRFLSTPLEVLLQISSYLATPELGSLRLVCRHLEVSLFMSFSHEFFTKRAFVLTEFSLRALVDISTSRFAPSLKYLIINLERPPQLHFNTPENHAVREEYYSHKCLINSGQDVELISQALQNLPNLETYGVRDFSSQGRYRDGGDEVWRPYGSETFRRRTGNALWAPSSGTYPSMADVEYVYHVFLTSLRALARAKSARSPARLEIILRRCHLPELAFNIPPYLEPTILPVLQDLKAFFLDMGLTTFPIHVIRTGGNNQNHSGHLVAQFISKLQSLQHLRLNFRNIAITTSRPFLRWLAQQPFTSVGTSQKPTSPDDPSHEFVHRPSLPFLEQLDIGWVTIDPYTLLNLFKSYKSSLRRISLHRVTLSNDSSAGVYMKPNAWARFLTQSTRLGLEITSITLSQVYQLRRRTSHQAEFRDPSRMSVATNIRTKGWTGSDWERGSRDLIESVFVDLPDEDDAQDEDETDVPMPDFMFDDSEEEFSEMGDMDDESEA